MNHTSPATTPGLTIVNTDGSSLELIPKRSSASSSQRAKTTSAAAAADSAVILPTPSLPSRIVYGPGTITRLPTELGYLHLSRPLIIATPSRAAIVRYIQALIPNLQPSILDSTILNVSPQVVDDAIERFPRIDGIISVGGSSAVGLARAISVRKSIPHVCIPTVSNATDMLSLSEHDSLIQSASNSNFDDAYAAQIAAAAVAAATASGGASNSSKRSGSSRKSDQARTAGSRSSGSKSSGSRASSRRSAAGRLAQSLSKPAVIIYDEELTAIHPRRLSVPTEPHSTSGAGGGIESGTSSFSFIQLPGI